MNNQPLPKPTQVTPPPSALDKAKSRIPLAQKKVGGKNPVGSAPPLGGSPPANGVKLPPTSLSALSSMSSNTIPKGKDVQVAQGKPLQKPTQPKMSPAPAPKTAPAPGKKQVQVSGGKNMPAPVPTPVQKTVLGAPIPQAIRGEALPKGLVTNDSKIPPVAKPTSPNLGGQLPTSLPEATSGLTPTKNPTGTPSPVPPTTSSAPVSQTTTKTSATTIPSASPKKTSPVPVAPNTEITKGQGGANAKGGNSNGNKPKFASEKKSIFKFLPFIVGGIAILAVVGFVISKLFGGGGATPLPADKSDSTTKTQPAKETEKRTEVPAEQKEIVYWGLWEPNEVVAEIIDDFEQENPGVKVTYVKQSHKDYRERLQTALDAGDGPDIFRFHASWTPMLKSDLYPIPSSVVSSKEFKDDYYPIVTDQLVVGGQYVGVPLMYDGLALYYNEDILESASETPPSTWAELRLLAAKLTVESANGIERAGLAIGNAENVDHFADILAILMLQNGADFVNPNSQETKDALLFYTNFVAKDGVWDNKLPSSTVAFARGDVAMMFAPSWRAHEINAQNPNLKFKTMPLPQLSDERITWGSYWVEGINSGSGNKEVASEFLSYLSSDENLMKLFSKASEVRAFGEIYPKASMAEKLVNDGVVASYLDDAVYAQGWYLSSFTHDNGINDQMIEYYKDGINAILEGEDVEDVVVTIEEGTKQLLKQYGISSK